MNNLKILYEDNHVIVVVKPVNVLSQGDKTNDLDMLSIIKAYIKEKYHKPGNVYLGLVHRLDRVVGGVMVFAKTSKAAGRLSESIRNGKLEKNYLAICHGKLKEKDTFIDYLKKLDDHRSIITNSSDGKLSELSYELIKYDVKKDISLVKVYLKTGRHHQIRVQFSERGYPLVGDKRYYHDNYTNIGLYAYRLSFIHPTTKKIMEFINYPTDEPFTIFKENLK